MKRRNLLILLSLFSLVTLGKNSLTTDTTKNQRKLSHIDSIKNHIDSVRNHVDRISEHIDSIKKNATVVKAKDESSVSHISNTGFYNESDFFTHRDPQQLDLQSWFNFKFSDNEKDTAWYLEARYGYEAFNTGAIYFGRQFGKEDLNITPMLGYVNGALNGVSFAATLEGSFTHYCFESENEYVLSTDDFNKPSFFYDWSKLYFFSKDCLGYGIGVQIHEGSDKTQNFQYYGVLLRIKVCNLIHVDLFGYRDVLSNNWVGTFALDIEDK